MKVRAKLTFCVIGKFCSPLVYLMAVFMYISTGYLCSSIETGMSLLRSRKISHYTVMLCAV